MSTMKMHIPSLGFIDSNAIMSAVISNLDRQGYGIPQDGVGFPMGFPSVSTSTFTFDNNERKLTLTPTPYFIVYVQSKELGSNLSKSATITNTTGFWYFYIDIYGELLCSQIAPDPAVYAPVATVYWSNSYNMAQTIVDQRHGATMDWATRLYLERTSGFVYNTGLDMNVVHPQPPIEPVGSDDAQAEILFTSDGLLLNQDLGVAITRTHTTAFYSQNLTPIAQVPVWWMTPGSVWALSTATYFPFLYQSNLNPKILYWNRTTDGSLQAVTDHYYYTTWIIGTPDVTQPIVGICGQNQYSTSTDARSEIFSSLDLTNFPYEDYVLLYRLIFYKDETYTDTHGCVIMYVSDYRTSNIGSSFAGTIEASSVLIVPALTKALNGASNVQQALTIVDRKWDDGTTGAPSGFSFTTDTTLGFSHPAVGTMDLCASGYVHTEYVAGGLTKYFTSGLLTEQARYFQTEVAAGGGLVDIGSFTLSETNKTCLAEVKSYVQTAGSSDLDSLLKASFSVCRLPGGYTGSLLYSEYTAQDMTWNVTAGAFKVQVAQNGDTRCAVTNLKVMCPSGTYIGMT